MVAVPGAMPVTMPVADTLATEVAVLLQLPPVVVSVRVTGLPVQTAEVPVIMPAYGRGLIVIVCIAVSAPQLDDII
jgi:hypothetical protein